MGHAGLRPLLTRCYLALAIACQGSTKAAETTKPLQPLTPPSSSVVRKGDSSCGILDNPTAVSLQKRLRIGSRLPQRRSSDYPHLQPRRPNHDSTRAGGAHRANRKTSGLATFARGKTTQSNIHLSTRVPSSFSISRKVIVRSRWRPRILSAHGRQGSAMSAAPPEPQGGQARHRPSIGMTVSWGPLHRYLTRN